jgi:phosphoglucosamine mutase
LEAAVARGLRAGGAVPVSLGVLPTPAVARAVRESDAHLGSDDHGVAQSGGGQWYQIFWAGWRKAHGCRRAGDRTAHRPDSAHSDEAALAKADGAVDHYIATAEAILPPRSLAGWKVVLDTANGATCRTSPVVFRNLGAEVIGLGDSPDGENINAGVGSEHPEPLAAKVRAAGARLGIAHDGDGDRCLLCDENGDVLDGDVILTILAMHALARRRLVKDTLVLTVQSNLGVDAAVAAAGGRVVRTSVGDRYVIERMAAEGATLGGESSGHIICSDVSPTGDGLVAALKVVEVMLATGKPLSELKRVLTKFPQLTSALKVKEKRPLDELPRVKETIQSLEAELGSRGRVLVRYSGTETKLRLLIEGAKRRHRAGRDGSTRRRSAQRTHGAVTFIFPLGMPVECSEVFSEASSRPLSVQPTSDRQISGKRSPSCGAGLESLLCGHSACVSEHKLSKPVVPGDLPRDGRRARPPGSW